jgi:myo-inositol-1(or 4)-monophosphatase
LQTAGAELTKRFRTELRTQTKPDASLVTDADLASERVILAALRREFPRDTIYSEESGLSAQARPTGGAIWLVDPLDGTTNFANGYPFYCVSIGRGRFRADGTIEMTHGGVLDVPRRRVYLATRGGGATVDGQRLRVTQERPMARAFLVTGFYYDQGTALQQAVSRFGRVASACQAIRRDGAAALDLALVAEGVFDAFWESGLKPWDVAAGSLLVEEAGGTVRTYEDETRYDVEAPSIISGAPKVVSEIAALL